MEMRPRAFAGVTIATSRRSLTLEHLEDALQFLAQRRGGNGLRDGHRPLRVRLRGGTLAAGLFEAVARAVDGETVLVEQLANAADEEHFMVLVIAPVAATLE